MTNNTFAEYEGRVYRILDVRDGVAVIIAQDGKTAPQRVLHNQIHGIARAGPEDAVLSEKQREKRDARFKIIESFCDDQVLYWDSGKRREAARFQAHESGCSIDTIERYLFLYWSTGDKNTLAPPERKKQESRNRELEANVKRAVRKYYLTMHKQTLRYAYIKMLQECYIDSGGALKDNFPSYRSFKHYYDKSRSLVNEIITREGKSYFCRNAKPVTGTVYDYVEDIGVYLCDATECDISLVSEVTGELIGRPILYMAVDAYSGMIAGIEVGLKGGYEAFSSCIYNACKDKVKFCAKYGVSIQKEDWPVQHLPSKLVCDRGKEFIGYNLEKVCEDLRIEIDLLPPFRPDLKGIVEKSFDLVQCQYKPVFKGAGVVDSDLGERGVPNYHLGATLTLKDFTRVLIETILHINNDRRRDDVILPIQDKTPRGI